MLIFRINYNDVEKLYLLSGYVIILVILGYYFIGIVILMLKIINSYNYCL